MKQWEFHSYVTNSVLTNKVKGAYPLRYDSHLGWAGPEKRTTARKLLEIWTARTRFHLDRRPKVCAPTRRREQKTNPCHFYLLPVCKRDKWLLDPQLSQLTASAGTTQVPRVQTYCTLAQGISDIHPISVICSLVFKLQISYTKVCIYIYTYIGNEITQYKIIEKDFSLR